MRCSPYVFAESFGQKFTARYQSQRVQKPVDWSRRPFHDSVLKLRPTVIPITLPIIAPATNSEAQ
jgi:hypothetical protein